MLSRGKPFWGGGGGLSVCLSVSECQGKQFDPEKQETVSLAIEQRRLELGNFCECQPWH